MRKIVILIILLGALLRVTEYASNPSLNADEALTALRLESITLKDAFFLRGFSEAQQQSYPILFIAALKAIKSLGGESEYALRFIVLAVSMGTLWFFYEAARLFLPGHWPLVALALFCISRDLIYASIELKPAAFDILSVLIFTWMIAGQAPSSWSWKKVLGCALAGFVLVFSSIAGIIFMVSSGSCLLIYWVLVKDHESVRKFTPVYSAVLLATVVYYFCSLQYIRESASLAAFWSSSFFPVGGSVVDQYQWIVVVFKRLFGKFLQYPTLLSAALFAIGLTFVWIKDKAQFIFLAVPVLSAMALSACKIYPFDGRAIFFLVPFVIIAIVQGMRFAVGFSAMRKTAALILVSAFFLLPLRASAEQFMEYAGPEEIKPLLYYIEQQERQSDAVLVYEGASQAYTYYSKWHELNKPPVIVSRKNIDEVLDRVEFDRQVKGRFWVIFTHVKYDARMNERLFILEKFKARARLVDSLELVVRPGSVIPTLEGNISASAYLFEA